MARGAAVRGLPDELPAMAALAETGVANVRSPDRRYVGYFQMDVEGWNTGAYRGYPQSRVAAALVHRPRGAGAPAQDRRWRRRLRRRRGRWGHWVGIVENPGRPATAHYQRRLEEARTLVGGDCLPTGFAPDRTPPALRTSAARAQRAPIAVRVRCAEACVAGLLATDVGGRRRGEGCARWR